MPSSSSIVLATLIIATASAAMTNRPLAQLSGVTRTDLQRHDLTASGREVIQARIGIAPGMSSARHSHLGEEVIYVLEGRLDERSPRGVNSIFEDRAGNIWATGDAGLSRFEGDRFRTIPEHRGVPGRSDDVPLTVSSGSRCPRRAGCRARRGSTTSSSGA